MVNQAVWITWLSQVNERETETFYVPGAVLFTFQMLSCLLLTTLCDERYSTRANGNRGLNCCGMKDKGDVCGQH